MARPNERVEELRGLIGLTQEKFAQRIGLTKSAYSQWKAGRQEVGSASLNLMAERWQVSLDSLWAREGTDWVEPSPALKKAQELLLLLLSREDTPGTAGARVVRVYTLLTGSQTDIGLLPSLTSDSWAEWLKWEPEEWLAGLADPGRIGEAQMKGAAMVAGWYDLRRTWLTWFQTGRASDLSPDASRLIQELARRFAQSGGDIIDLRRRLHAPA